ncbi:MAG TPA: NADH-quinone oxidoreductase subunit NuoG [Gammaproteobacteria bacterium]|jgi:NADH-quinone oxidoreductase subunit G|nr:NADH-quinone oxidoreductase subunit NuoG [Gammaproteobacteria bacterium]
MSTPASNVPPPAAGAPAAAAPPADPNVVNVEVNGVPLKARKGQMIIEVTDAADIYVPRFCYHPKLTIAANCRMCLVEVEKAPKPLPACATPVAEGMKIFTKSKRAISAQKATMEFLLINHPLDCPICDQGGECELQDLAMGFGRGVSRYTERKRIVKDKNLGPLVSTDMTRCIHCTRCVRFGQEIAGIQELGTTFRSDRSEIGTYIEKSVDHEMSGNIIDLCPVGALNNKPFRYNARAWEMTAKPIVSPHDCAGSNLYAHVLRGKLRRVVPRDNEAINEAWIADRDRFGCYGVYSNDRLDKPRVKRNGQWLEVSWQDALVATVAALKGATKGGGDALGTLVSPSATVEEQYLLGRITRHLGSNSIDHRLRQRDFRDQAADPVAPVLGCSIADIETRQGILVVGSNLRMEVPIVAHRVRKAARKGASVAFVNPAEYEYHFKTAAYVAGDALVANLAGVLAAAASAAGKTVPSHVERSSAGATVTDAHRAAAATLARQPGLVLLGQIAQRHPQYAELRALAAALADLTGAALGYLSEGANAVGAALAGALPHRGVGGRSLAHAGLDAQSMLSSPRKAYILFGIEPGKDLANGAAALTALRSAAVVCFTPYVTDELLDVADILLPTATFAETAGTFVNAEGRWQSFDAVADLPGDARPGWRVLRVLGNELDMPACDYRTPSDVAAALEHELGAAKDPQPGDTVYRGSFAVVGGASAVAAAELDVPIYAIDAVVRRSAALQATALAKGSLRGGV